MCGYWLKEMQSEEEINGKAYVHYKSWHETYPELVDAAYLNRITPERCMEIAHKRRENTIVAKDGDKVVGFVNYGAYRSDALSECGEYGEIYAIYVLEAYHGKKVGYALMNAALEKISGCNTVAVWVLKGNDRAIRFYERYGFRLDGTEKEIVLGTPNTELRMLYERDACANRRE